MKRKLIKIIIGKYLNSFGSYLLSDKRNESIMHKENKNLMHHVDIENWLDFNFKKVNGKNYSNTEK